MSPAVALEAELMRAARSAGIRLIGPNCLGVMRPDRGLNATFAARLALPGRLAFVSQSGALCTSIRPKPPKPTGSSPATNHWGRSPARL